MNESFEGFKEKALPIFDEAISRISAEFSRVNLGRAVEEKQIYMSALLPEIPGEDPDLVELVVSVSDYNGPLEVEADVIWGHPSGQVEATFRSTPVAANSENLERLYLELPRLIEALRIAIIRGRPL